MDVVGAKPLCEKGGDRARGGVDGVGSDSTHSVSVTVGTIHPQHF